MLTSASVTVQRWIRRLGPKFVALRTCRAMAQRIKNWITSQYHRRQQQKRPRVSEGPESPDQSQEDDERSEMDGPVGIKALSDSAIRGRVTEGCAQLLRANRTVLWEIAQLYNPHKVDLPPTLRSVSDTARKHMYFRSWVPKTGGTSRYHVPILSVEHICKFTADWGIYPAICSKKVVETLAMELLQEQMADSDEYEHRMSFIQFCQLLRLIAFRIEGFPLDVSDEDRLRFLLRIMSCSDAGPKKWLQDRTATRTLKFVDLNSPTFTLSAQLSSNWRGVVLTIEQEVSKAGHRYSPAVEAIISAPTTVYYDLHELIKQNVNVLFPVFISYVDPSSSFAYKQLVGYTKADHRNTMPLLVEDQLWNLFRDFGVCPKLCSKARLAALHKQALTDPSVSPLLSFMDFLKLFELIAEDPANTLSHEDSLEERLDMILNVMDKSPGRSKFARLSRSSTVLPSFTLLRDLRHKQKSQTADAARTSKAPGSPKQHHAAVTGGLFERAPAGVGGKNKHSSSATHSSSPTNFIGKRPTSAALAVAGRSRGFDLSPAKPLMKVASHVVEPVRRMERRGKPAVLNPLQAIPSAVVNNRPFLS